MSICYHNNLFIQKRVANFIFYSIVPQIVQSKYGMLVPDNVFIHSPIIQILYVFHYVNFISLSKFITSGAIFKAVLKLILLSANMHINYFYCISKLF